MIMRRSVLAFACLWLLLIAGRAGATNEQFPANSSTTGVPLNCSIVVHGAPGTCGITASAGTAVRLTGFTVTGNPGNSVGSAIITVTGLFGGTLQYVFNLTAQVAGNPASTEVLNVTFPVPTPGNVGGSVSIVVPAMGNSTSTIAVAMHALQF